jgi:hypothetical protein
MCRSTPGEKKKKSKLGVFGTSSPAGTTQQAGNGRSATCGRGPTTSGGGGRRGTRAPEVEPVEKDYLKRSKKK